jgi:nickel transport protein
MNAKQNLRLCGYFIAAVLWLISSHSVAHAHKVSLSAWVQGDTVYIQSKFSGGRKVQNATVVVYDDRGNQLLEGKTDRNGEFSSKVPQKTDLKVVLKTSTGHMVKRTIPLEEIVAESIKDKMPASSSPEKSKIDAEKIPEHASDVKSERVEAPSETASFDQQQLEGIIEKLLDKKLAPINRMLADAMDRRPGLTEILGGIGYIFGLVGIALYVANRRRKGQ